MKETLYKSLYRLLQWLSITVDSQVIRSCKLAVGGSLLALSGSCAKPQNTAPSFPVDAVDSIEQKKDTVAQKTVAPVDTTKEDPDSQIFCYVTEEMPQFPGGDAELLKYISKQLDVYWPITERQDSTYGRVILSFVINTTGEAVESEVMRGLNPHLDSIALKVISNMPRWIPGKQMGKVVRVKYTVPVTFRKPEK